MPSPLPPNHCRPLFSFISPEDRARLIEYFNEDRMSFSSEDSLDDVPLSIRLKNKTKTPTPIPEKTPNPLHTDPSDNDYTTDSNSPNDTHSSDTYSIEGAPSASSISPMINSEPTSPPPSPIPFEHWEIRDEEIDIEWG